MEKIKIGALGPRSGPYWRTGLAFERGLELGCEYVNANGGVLGKEIDFVYEDHQNDPKKSVAGLEKMITEDNIVALVGENRTATVLADIPVVEKHKVPFVISEAWCDEATRRGSDWVFRSGTSDELIVSECLLPFIKSQNYKKVGFVTEYYGWGISYIWNIFNELKDSNIEFLSVLVDESARDFTAQLQALKDFGAEFIVSVVYGTGQHYVIKQAREMGITPKALIFDAAGCPSYWPDYWPVAGDGGELAMFITRVHRDVEYTPLTKWLVENYEKKYNEPFESIEYKVMSMFDSVLVVADAIRRANSTDGEAMRKVLESTNLEVAGGKVVFGGSEYLGTVRYHQNLNAPLLICQYQNRKPVVVWPSELATGELIKG